MTLSSVLSPPMLRDTRKTGFETGPLVADWYSHWALCVVPTSMTLLGSPCRGWAGLSLWRRWPTGKQRTSHIAENNETQWESHIKGFTSRVHQRGDHSSPSYLTDNWRPIGVFRVQRYQTPDTNVLYERALYIKAEWQCAIPQDLVSVRYQKK